MWCKIKNQKRARNRHTTVYVSSEADYVKEKIKAQKAEENIVSDDEGMRLCRGQEETGPESGEIASIQVAVHTLALELLLSVSISWFEKSPTANLDDIWVRAV